jgi:uncharacterized protein (TIGR02757 family)
LTDRLAGVLEDVYSRWNRREYVHPDPLEFLYAYEDLPDREIAGLVASGLAYGRVAQILGSVGAVLEALGPSPSSIPERRLKERLAGFRHRFTPDSDLVRAILGARRLQREHGSLGGFVAGAAAEGGILEAQRRLVAGILEDGPSSSLLSCPTRGSCCKRLNLWFRWMVRKDSVDPGGWAGVPASELLVPLDTHMWKIGRRLGFTRRNSPDLKAAMEITEGFGRLNPEDPVKYDFALTRFGIRSDLTMESLFSKLDPPGGL